MAASVIGGFAFAGMVSPGERFFYPALWISMCWLTANWKAPEHPAVARGASMILVALIVIQAALLDTYGAMVSRRLSDLVGALRAAESSSEFCLIYETYRSASFEPPHRNGADRFLTNHPSAPRLPYYIYIEDQNAAPIFQIGMLSYDGPGDNEDLCR